MAYRLISEGAINGPVIPLTAADSTASVEQLVLASLFTDARDAAAPGGPRGWWADTLGPAGDRFGSLLWTLTGPITAELLQRAKQYSERALAWMVTDGIATAIAVTATETVGAVGRVDLVIRIDGVPLTYTIGGP